MSFKKLLYESSGFTDQERSKILYKGKQKRPQLIEWEEAIKMAFKKHYNLNKAKLNKNTLGVTAFAQKEELLDVLKNDLKIIIEVRNKLAHGQWFYPLTKKGDKVDNNKYQLINQKNLLSLQFKYSLINQLADVIHDLIVSPATFKRDFDKHFKKIYQQRENLKKRKYEKYEQNLIICHQKRS